MKLEFVGELRSVIKGKDFLRRNGDTDYSVHLTVEVDGRSEYFECDKEVLKAWENGVIEKGSMCDFTADYNPRFKFNQFVIKTAVAQ